MAIPGPCIAFSFNITPELDGDTALLTLQRAGQPLAVSPTRAVSPIKPIIRVCHNDKRSLWHPFMDLEASKIPTRPPLHLGVRPLCFGCGYPPLSLRVFFHPRRWWIASQTVSSTLTRAYHLQFDSTIVHGAYGVVVRCNISSTASRY